VCPIKHPLRNLQLTSIVIGWRRAAKDRFRLRGSLTRYSLAEPRVPWIDHFADGGIAGLKLSSCTTPSACTAPSATSRPRTSSLAATRRSSPLVIASWPKPAKGGKLDGKPPVTWPRPSWPLQRIRPERRIGQRWEPTRAPTQGPRPTGRQDAALFLVGIGSKAINPNVCSQSFTPRTGKSSSG
jgi:hypothetical protein